MVATLLISPAVGFFVLFGMPTHAPAGARTFGACMIAAVFLFSLWVLFSTRYTIDAVSLVVQSGPFRWTVPLKDIRAVRAVNDLRSGPALSLDRLRIEYADARPLLISPRERERFLADLAARGVPSLA